MAGRARVVARSAKRAAPVALELYRRWDRMTPQEKERYRAMVRRSGERARLAAAQAREQLRQRRGRR